MSERIYCSALSAREPLDGSASGGIDTWLGVEISGAWPAQAMMADGVSPLLRDVLTRWQSEPGRRVQLLKTTPATPPSAWLCANGRLWRWTMSSDLSELNDDHPPTIAVPVEEPVVWVCTHGKRDLCCARLGLPVYRALVDDGRVHAQQTSHLGGHRFAATALVLPQGILYGQLDAHSAGTLAEHVRQGRVWLDKVRGRSAVSPRLQAAELAARRHLEDDASDVTFTESAPYVTVTLGTSAVRVRAEQVDGPTLQTSCVSDERKPTKTWQCAVVTPRR